MTRIFSAALLCALALPAPAASPLAPATSSQKAPAGADAKEKKTYTVGSLVRRDLALPTLKDPESAKLVFGPLEELETPPVVLMWWSMRDPLCRKSEPKIHKLAAEYEAKGVRFYLVDSNHDELVAGLGDPLEKIRKMRKDAKITLPLLLDRGNKVADEFGTLCSNHVFVIDEKRTVRFHGSIDNDPRGQGNVQLEEYLREALDLALEGKSPEFALRRPQGRQIKRAPEEPAPSEKAPPAKKR